jgi:hypothetical protein
MRRTSELALSIARLTGQEQPFIRLLRQSCQDPGTTASQAVSAFKKRLSALDDGELAAIANDCAHAFARDDFTAGVSLLCQLVTLLPKGTCPEVTVKIINRCDQALRESGPGHLEYVILTLHTLDVISPYLSRPPVP